MSNETGISFGLEWQGALDTNIVQEGGGGGIGHGQPVKVKSPQQKKRKHEQNKDAAATHYRVKKREEQEMVQKEPAGLEKDNVELKEH